MEIHKGVPHFSFSYHTWLFSSDFWIFCAIESINQSFVSILCAVESINQSINQG